MWRFGPPDRTGISLSRGPVNLQPLAGEMLRGTISGPRGSRHREDTVGLVREHKPGTSATLSGERFFKGTERDGSFDYPFMVRPEAVIIGSFMGELERTLRELSKLSADRGGRQCHNQRLTEVHNSLED